MAAVEYSGQKIPRHGHFGADVSVWTFRRGRFRADVSAQAFRCGRFGTDVWAQTFRTDVSAPRFQRGGFGTNFHVWGTSKRLPSCLPMTHCRAWTERMSSFETTDCFACKTSYALVRLYLQSCFVFCACRYKTVSLQTSGRYIRFTSTLRRPSSAIKIMHFDVFWGFYGAFIIPKWLIKVPARIAVLFR